MGELLNYGWTFELLVKFEIMVDLLLYWWTLDVSVIFELFFLNFCRTLDKNHKICTFICNIQLVSCHNGYFVNNITITNITFIYAAFLLLSKDCDNISFTKRTKNTLLTKFPGELPLLSSNLVKRKMKGVLKYIFFLHLTNSS